MMYDENMIRPMREEMTGANGDIAVLNVREAWKISTGKIEGAIEVDPDVRRDPSDD